MLAGATEIPSVLVRIFLDAHSIQQPRAETGPKRGAKAAEIAFHSLKILPKISNNRFRTEMS